MEVPIIVTEQMTYAFIGCIAFMLIDIITGLIYAFKSNTFSSPTMREGLYHKSALVIIMVCAILIECLILHLPDLGFNAPIFVPACILIILMELASILENLVKINPELEDNKILGLFSSNKLDKQ